VGDWRYLAPERRQCQALVGEGGWIYNLWLAGEKTVQGDCAGAGKKECEHRCEIKEDEFAVLGSWPIAEEGEVMHKSPGDDNVSEAVESGPPGREADGEQDAANEIGEKGDQEGREPISMGSGKCAMNCVQCVGFFSQP
jgi:hypothetical protein